MDRRNKRMSSRVNMPGSESHLNLFHFTWKQNISLSRQAHLMFPCQPIAETWDRLNPKERGADKKERERKSQGQTRGWAGKGEGQCTTEWGGGSSKNQKCGIR